MIPYLPQGASDEESVIFYQSILDNLVTRSYHHEAWHTHKRDSSVCWICDLVELTKLVIKEMERHISKSSLDIDEQLLVQDINSEDDTVNYNVSDEPVDELQPGDSQ